MIGRKGVAARLAVVVFLALASGALAQKSPTPPPGEPGVQPCLVRNGITICDPALIELILRYNLEVLPAFPPGVIPIVVETLAELEALLSAFLGAVAVVGGEGDPIAGPHDPGTALGEICIMRWDSELGGFVCVAYPAPPPPPAPPSLPAGEGDSSGNTSSASIQQRIEQHTVLGACTPSVWIAVLVTGWQVCVRADAWYYPGQRFTAITNLQVNLVGITDVILAGVVLKGQTADYRISGDGKSVTLVASANLEIWAGIRHFDATLGVAFAVDISRTFTVPNR